MIANTIIRDLNDILKKQLTAINQFFVHSKFQKKNGFGFLAKKYAMMAVQGGKTADKLLEILIDLDQVPQIKDYDLLKSDKNVDKQLILDIALLHAMTKDLHNCAKKCRAGGEIALEKELLEIVQETESVLDWLESQFSILNAIGLESYKIGLKDAPTVQAGRPTH